MFTFYVKPDASFTVVDHFQEIRDISGVTDRCYRVLDDYLFENIVILTNLHYYLINRKLL